MQWKFGLRGASPETEAALEQILATAIDETPTLERAVILAFDAAHTIDGQFDDANTHLYVTNEYVFELCQRHPKWLPGASVHPYRKDAVAEIERCVAAGAVLLKWLPIVQNFNPMDRRCEPVYEALAHFGLPLLSHTGAENSLPNIDRTVADPMLLRPALERGVKVIMAHCGSRAFPWETNYVGNFVRLANEYEHCYGDTAALNAPCRWYAYDQVFADPVAKSKLLHGSDWPILPLPPMRVGWEKLHALVKEPNWLKRDIGIKEAIGFDDAYWHRAATVLRLTASQ